MKVHEKALLRSTYLTMWFIVAMTIWAELSAPFKGFLTGVLGHHWITKGVFALVFFILLYAVMSRQKDNADIKKETNFAVASAVLGGLAIFLFYVWHFIAG